VIKALDPLGGLAPQQLHLLDRDPEADHQLAEGGGVRLARGEVEDLVGQLPEALHQGGLLLVADLGHLGMDLPVRPVKKRLARYPKFACRLRHVPLVGVERQERLGLFLVAVGPLRHTPAPPDVIVADLLVRAGAGLNFLRAQTAALPEEERAASLAGAVYQPGVLQVVRQGVMAGRTAQ
jgi:hypothetical protein